MSRELRLHHDSLETGPVLSGPKESGEEPRLSGDKEMFIHKAFEEDPQKGIELLFREYYLPLCSHAIRFVYSRDIARDLVSDIFCSFFQKKLYKRIDTSYRAYLYMCVRNESLKYIMRETGRETEISQEKADDENAAGVFTPEDLLRYEELSSKIETVIKGLPPQSQRVFLMNRYDGKKYQEVAAELQISLKTVEAHMSKALSILREALKPDWLGLLILILIR